jgi:hypothetical protein
MNKIKKKSHMHYMLIKFVEFKITGFIYKYIVIILISFKLVPKIISIYTFKINSLKFKRINLIVL